MDTARTQGIFHRLELESENERQERKRLALRHALQYAAGHSPEFRDRLKNAGLLFSDVLSPEGYSQLPVLRKTDIIRLQAEKGPEHFLVIKPGEFSRIFQSPGPIYDFEGRGRDYWGWAEAFHACGFRSGDLVQMTFSYHLTPAGLMLEEPLRILECAVIPAGPGNTNVQLELMKSLPVTGFVGMASYLKVIGERALQSGLDPARDLKLQVAFVAAERLSDALRTEVQDMFGITVRQGYGTADVGCIAYECPQAEGMHISSRAFVEICDPKTGLPVPEGQAGEVVVSTFHTDYPVLRLATGDLSMIVSEPCPCGRTSRRLAGILGRVDTTVKVKGQFIYEVQAAGVMERFPQVQDWRLVVTNETGREVLHAWILTPEELDAGRFAAAFQAELKLRPHVHQVSDPGDFPESEKARIIDRRCFDE